jgi:hypothetical protein
MSQIVKFIQTDLGSNHPYSLLTISQIDQEQKEDKIQEQIINAPFPISKFRISNRKLIRSSKR